MNRKPIEQAKTSDLAKSLSALRRAAEQAHKLVRMMQPRNNCLPARPCWKNGTDRPPKIHGMSTSATELSFDSGMMWVSLADGRKLGVPLAYFPLLLAATPDQLKNFELSGRGTGIHWDELDEDISVEGLLMGVGDRTRGNRIAV